MDAFVELLFKYRPVMFERGVVGFASRLPLWLLLVSGLVLLGLGLWPYLRGGESLRVRDRIFFGVLRGLAVATLLFCLARPVLVVAAAVPQRNVVGIVVDDSRSMRIADVGGISRGGQILRQAGGADSALVRELAKRFQVRFFRTSGAGGRSSSLAGLSFDATRTRLLPSLMRAGEELQGAPVAGLVLLSDGADNSTTVTGAQGLSEQLLALRARGVPVYSVGIGSERFDRDIEIARVDAPRVVLKDATLAVDVVVMQRGYGGRKLAVVIEDAGRIVGTKEVALPRDGEAVVAHVRVPTTEAGARTLTVRVPVQEGELVKENNEKRTLVVVRDRKEKILYLEGEPRFELKFIRRAVEGDENLQLVTLLRSAKDKYLRLSVDDSLELASGFPKTREELFAYRAVILGSVEASYFTLDQQRMISDFVNVRGGGLLALGGRLAFGEGGYVGTPLTEVLPVELAGTPATAEEPAMEVVIRPTPAGLLHPAMQLAATDSLTSARWTTMPHLTMVNAIGRPKPGATVLLEAFGEDQRSGVPVFAFQRFGRGKVAAFAVQDSWTWQMDADVAVDDQSHETFWRQVLRWLVSDVPDRVDVVAPDESGTGESVVLRAGVSDAAFLRANGATVTGRLAGAGGDTATIPFDWSSERDGEYRASFLTDSSGVQEIRVRAIVGKDTLKGEPTFVRVAEPTAEYFGAGMRPALLRQIADETGGRYYDLASIAQLPKDIVYSKSGATVTERYDLWDMPVVFVLLIGALGAEWLLRRRRGMA